MSAGSDTLTGRVGGVVDALPALDEGAAALVLHRLRVNHGRFGAPLTNYSPFKFIIHHTTPPSHCAFDFERTAFEAAAAFA